MRHDLDIHVHHVDKTNDEDAEHNKAQKRGVEDELESALPVRDICCLKRPHRHDAGVGAGQD